MNTKKISTSWWTDQINAGIKFRKKYTHQQKWDAWRSYYRGVWRPGVLPINLFFMMTRTIVPRIYFRNPSISLTPAKPGPLHMAFSQVLERVDNKLIRRLKVKKQMKRIVQDAFMFGTGFGKLGYGAQYTLTPDLLKDTEQPYGKRGERYEYHSSVIANHPWLLRIPPGQIIVPTGAESPEDMMWYAHWVRRPLQDVKRDPRFKNTELLKATSTQSIEQETKIEPDIQKPIQMTDLYEVHDAKWRRVFVISPTADKPLYDASDEFQFEDGFNLYPLIFNEDDEVFWGVPDSQILEPYQLEINEIRTQAMKHRRVALVKIFAKIGSISKEEADKMLSEEVAAIVWTLEDPNIAVDSRKLSEIPADLDRAKFEVLNDVRETVGFSRNQFGEYAAGGKSGVPTATEAQIVQMASEIRVDERRDMVADLLVEAVGDWHELIFTYWTEEQVVDIIGPGGIQLWVAFTGRELGAGRYEVKIDPDSTLPETKSMREQKALVVYERLKLNPLIDPEKLTRYLLHELHGVQYDDMMKGMPKGQGMSPGQPMNMGQLTGTIQQGQKMGLSTPPGGMK